MGYEEIYQKLQELSELYLSSDDTQSLEFAFLKKFSDDQYEVIIEEAMIEFMRTGDARYFDLFNAFLLAIKNSTRDNELYSKIFKIGVSYFDHKLFNKKAFVNRIKALSNRKFVFLEKEYSPQELMDLIEKINQLKYVLFEMILDPELTKENALKDGKKVREYVQFHLNK